MSSSEKDLIQSAVDYVNNLKPYHSKVLEVDVAYLSEDNVQANIIETLVIEDDLGNIYVNV